jgi:hypothetical protein
MIIDANKQLLLKSDTRHYVFHEILTQAVKPELGPLSLMFGTIVKHTFFSKR